MGQWPRLPPGPTLRPPGSRVPRTWPGPDLCQPGPAHWDLTAATVVRCRQKGHSVTPGCPSGQVGGPRDPHACSPRLVLASGARTDRSDSCSSPARGHWQKQTASRPAPRLAKPVVMVFLSHKANRSPSSLSLKTRLLKPLNRLQPCARAKTAGPGLLRRGALSPVRPVRAPQLREGPARRGLQGEGLPRPQAGEGAPDHHGRGGAGRLSGRSPVTWSQNRGQALHARKPVQPESLQPSLAPGGAGGRGLPGEGGGPLGTLAPCTRPERGQRPAHTG